MILSRYPTTYKTGIHESHIKRLSNSNFPKKFLATPENANIANKLFSLCNFHMRHRVARLSDNDNVMQV